MDLLLSFVLLIFRLLSSHSLAEALSLCLGTPDWNAPVFLQGGRWYEVERPDPSFFSRKRGMRFASSTYGCRQARGTAAGRSVVRSLCHVLLLFFPYRWILGSSPSPKRKRARGPPSVSPASPNAPCVVATQGLLINPDGSKKSTEETSKQRGAFSGETEEETELRGFSSVASPPQSSESHEESVLQRGGAVAPKRITEARTPFSEERKVDRRDQQEEKERFSLGPLSWCGVIALQVFELLLRGDQELYQVRTGEGTFFLY